MHEGFLVHSRRGAYVALVVLTLIWGGNWVVMKFALSYADPVLANIQRTWLATFVLFAVLFWQRRPIGSSDWRPSDWDSPDSLGGHRYISMEAGPGTHDEIGRAHV